VSARRLRLARIDAPAPIGPVLLACNGDVLVCRDFGAPETRLWPLLRARFGPGVALEEADAPPDLAVAIRAYFAGRLGALADVPADGGGTAFQRRAWAALRAIPPGETRSYGDIAACLDQPRAARAVGLANALNPISLVVPCHRVIDRAGGLDRLRRWHRAQALAARA